MKRTLILLMMLLSATVFGQVNAIQLEDCYRLARENYPRLSDRQRQQEISDLKLKNIGTVWNPQLNLNGQATYQSEVTRVSVALPGITIPSASKDQYKLYLDLKQTIYDGGISNAGKNVERSSLAAEQQSLEVELYALHEKVGQLYFMILLVVESEEVLKLKSLNLARRIEVLESGFRNGMVTARDLEMLKAEQLLTSQQISDLHFEKLSGLGALGILTGSDLNENTRLSVPANRIKSASIARPELRYFDLLGSRLDENAQMLQKSRNPKLFGFGQAGYGRPGLNMLKNSFDTYYLVGLGVSWNITDWKQTDRSRKILEIQKQMVGSQRASFDLNLSVSLFRANEAIGKAEQMLKIDDELELLRDNIARQSASQLENGTITSADYIVDLNASIQAKINKKSHEVQLCQAVENYNILSGKPVAQATPATKLK